VKQGKKRAPARPVRKAKTKAKKPATKKTSTSSRTKAGRKPRGASRTLELQPLLDSAKVDYASEDKLERMARAGDPAVRALVAISPRAPRAALEILTKDDDVYVRRKLVRSSRLGRDLARQLLDDPDDEVRSKAVWSAAPGQLRDLGRDPSPLVRGEIAAHRDVTVPLLRTLASDHDQYVRQMVAIGGLTPWGILRQLSEDPDAQVWRLARLQLEKGSRLCDCCGKNHGLPDTEPEPES